MKIVKLNIDLVIEDEDAVDLDTLVRHLNDKLYNDPDFFGNFDHENVVEIATENGDLLYHQ